MPEQALARRSIQRVLTRILAVGFLALIGLVVSAGYLMALNQRQADWVQHTYKVERQIYAMRNAVAQIEALTWRTAAANAPARLADSLSAQGALDLAIGRLATLTADNPSEQARIPVLRREARVLDQVADASTTGPGVHHDARTETRATQAADALTRMGAAMMAEEEQLMAQRIEAQRSAEQTFYVMLALAFLLLVVVGVLTFTNLRGYTRALNESREALRRLNASLEEAVQERTAELKRANEEIQRFAYIVSHDLRSPLVNVMGFTAELEAATITLRDMVATVDEQHSELVPDEARQVVRDELPEAIHFIRTSTQKMDRLINAILRLSREGRRSLNPERLDLGVLCGQVIDTLRIRIDEAEADVRIEGKLPTIVSDRVAIEQMISNLVENAIKYRAPGRTPVITISSRGVGPRIALDITDNGRGIAPHDHERVFDLFRRSGQQDQPGEGIGLAHVRALSYRLGGSVTLQSTPGQGSTFTINLPIQFVGE
ncbi:MAG TPA: ATP-binding protein [Novosphingobium sp.]|nr:ATP-binding protein [Novosphingobium sp.]